MVWSQQWTLSVDGTNVNDNVLYVAFVPELDNVPQQRVILAAVDGDYPVFIRTQQMEGPLTFLVAMKGVTNDTVYQTRKDALRALFTTNAYHTLTAQVRGMPAQKTVKFIVESLDFDYKTRTCVIRTVAPKPVLV